MSRYTPAKFRCRTSIPSQRRTYICEWLRRVLAPPVVRSCKARLLQGQTKAWADFNKLTQVATSKGPPKRSGLARLWQAFKFDVLFPATLLGFWGGGGCLRGNSVRIGLQKAFFPGIFGGSSGLHWLPTLSLGGMGPLFPGFWVVWGVVWKFVSTKLGGRGPSLLAFWDGRGCLRGKNFRIGVAEGPLSWVLGGGSGLHGLPTLSLGGMGPFFLGFRWYGELCGSSCLQKLGGRGPSLLGFWDDKACLKGKGFRIGVAEGPLSWGFGWEFWASWVAYSELGWYGPFSWISGGMQNCLEVLVSLLGFWDDRGCLRGKSFRIGVAEGPPSWDFGWQVWASWVVYSELGWCGAPFC